MCAWADCILGKKVLSSMKKVLSSIKKVLSSMKKVLSSIKKVLSSMKNVLSGPYGPPYKPKLANWFNKQWLPHHEVTFPIQYVIT